METSTVGEFLKVQDAQSAGLGLNQSIDRRFNPGQRAPTVLPISRLDNAETVGTASLLLGLPLGKIPASHLHLYPNMKTLLTSSMQKPTQILVLSCRQAFHKA